MLAVFRSIAVLEGISYLMLFAISMPLKYWAGIGGPNKYIGYIHGALFIAYVVLAVALRMKDYWGNKRLVILLLASLLPFGTFYEEHYYLKPLQKSRGAITEG